MAEKKDDSNWMQTLWRPAMGWMYMLICLLDMAVFPVLWSLLQAMMHVPITQWNPLTLQGAGLFHIAMGAVLGISAFGRTQEKLAGTAANPTATSTITTQNTNMSGVPAGMGNMNTGGFGNMNTGGFGSQQPAFGQTPSFGTPTPAFGTPTPAFGTPTPAFGTAAPTPAFGAPLPAPVTGQVASGFGGKPAPVLAPDPII